MRLVKALILIILLVAGGYTALFFHEALIGRNGELITFEISEGDVAADIALKMEQQNIIPDASRYLLYGRIDRSVYRAKAGVYQVNARASFRELARQFAMGPERTEVVVRLIEGWTVDDITETLREDQGIPREETATLVGRSINQAPFDRELREEYAFLDALPPERSLEGYLFPDTYHVWEDQLPAGLIYKQLNEFNRQFGHETPGRDIAPLETLDDIVTLASIVEREVADPDERRIVAGIFLNRLRIGMRLQSDATINYLTGSGRTRSTAADLEIESPYNTYRNAGLPPSPIGNPGASSIEAVLHPTETDYFYFLTTEEGETLYARTLEEHAQNRARAGY